MKRAKNYFNDLTEKQRSLDSNFKPTYDIDILDYHFNSVDEPIDPISYTLINSTKETTLKIVKNDDINNNTIFNLDNGSTIEIEVGKGCELLKTMLARIKLKLLEGTELNQKIANKNHEILLNLKDSSPENIKKQIVNYFKSKKFEGYYIPEDYYEQILKTDCFYVQHYSDHFELNINFNEKAKGYFLTPTGSSDNDLDYFKNYKEEDGDFNPPKRDEPNEPKGQSTNYDVNKIEGIDSKTKGCACCGKCLQCSNCKNNDKEK